MATTQQSLQFSPGEAKFGQRYVWQLPLRATHWVMAASVITLFATGLFISAPVFGPVGGEAYRHFVMGRFREVHFVAGYALLFSFILRGYWFFAGNKYARSGMPVFWQRQWRIALKDQMGEYMSIKRGPTHLGHNSLAGLSYALFVGGLGLAQILTGFALYSEDNPGGFWNTLFGWVIPLLGGSFRTHMWHHLFAWGFVVFLILHLYLVLFGSVRYKNGLLSSMISGDKFFREGDLEQ
jgi:Ni/Fe-hydrogenase 1 B-type cytochrome subunit